MKVPLSLLAPLISLFMSHKSYGNTKRCMVRSVGFLFMPIAYILGCAALYSYVQPLWGTTMAWLVLAGVISLSSLLCFVVGWFLKPKDNALTKANTVMEGALGQISNARLPLAALMAVGAVAAYFVFSKNKDN